MIAGMLLLVYGVGLLFGSLSLIEWLVRRLVRLYLGGSFAGIEARLVKLARRIAR